MKKQNKLLDIEQFIIDSGSDDQPTFGGKPGGIQCQQIADELANCILAILESGERVESYLEIGSAAGGSAFLISYFFNPSRIVLVDNNKHPKAHIRPYILRDILHDEVIGDSHDASTVERVKLICGVYDAVMIDGDHFYNGVKADIEAYGKLLRNGGFLIVHDTRIGDPFGSMKAFNELKAVKDWVFVGEYVTKKHHKPCGIGLFRRVDEDQQL